MSAVRYISLQNIIYDLKNGDKLKIFPFVPGTRPESQCSVKLEHENYEIETEGNFNLNNMSEDTLNNFADFLCENLEALSRLT
jgi:hypothetical protein